MGILVRDKEFYHKLIAIAVPVALQNLIGFAVSMADTVMLGMLGEVQLSASSIANQLGFIFMLLCFGIGGGSSVLVAQFWGKGDTESIRKVLTIMYRMLFVSAFIFMALAIFLPRQIIGIFTTDKDVISEAVKFLKIVGFSYLFSGITDTTVSVLRAVHTVKISLLGNISALVTNVFLNWVLIFGNLGAPALGVEGAAIATCMARVIGVTIIIVYMGFFERKIGFRLRMLFSKKLGMLSNFIHNAMPVTLNELLWGSGMAVIAVIIGRMGREFTAANAICTVLSQLVNVALFGVASASAVIIGNTIGKGEYVRAKAYAHTLLAISFALGIVASGFVWILKAPILNLYNISETGKHYADQLISIYSILVIGISISCTCMIGILRGGGDNKIVLVLDVLFMWCLCIPFGFLTGIYLHWPVWAVFIILKFDEVFKVTFSLLRIFKGNWINNVTINLEESGENPKVTV